MAKAELPLHAPGTQLDKGYIGQSVPRPNAQRLLQGRGTFLDDLRFPRLAHVAFLRSPYAHAKIKTLEFKAALASPGVIGAFDGRAVAEYCTPWIAVLAHLKGIKSPPQHAIAIERACSIDRKSTRLNSSHEWNSYAVFCLKKEIVVLADREGTGL